MEDLRVLCQIRPDGGAGYPLISCFSNWFSSLGLYSLKLKDELFGRFLESQIPCFSSMGKQLTEKPVALNEFPPITVATLYI